MRFLPEQRLRTRADFNRPRNSGQRVDCAVFVCCLYPPRIELERPLRRLGIIASKKVGNAVQRNRVKRLFREIFRLNQERLPAACDVLIIVRQACVDCDFTELQERFRDAIGRFS